MKDFLPVLFSIFLTPVFTAAQSDSSSCFCPLCPYVIPDGGQLTVEIPVGGAVMNDLGSPAQGLAGVRLHFNHEYLGDLNISLVSPAGQSVSLVDPIGFFGPTDENDWNVWFVPCDSMAHPDPGLTSVWSNANSWGLFTNYSGSYYPASGCLEMINQGPVNGVWKLVATDAQFIDSGNILDAELLFRDTTGIRCGYCAIFPVADFSTAIDADGWTVNFSNILPQAVNYLVDFGDGTTYSGNQIPMPHTYPDTGAYTIRWIVNNSCNSDTAFQAVFIPGNLPHAIFGFNSVCDGNPATIASLNNDHVAQWHWYFPGGNPAESFDMMPQVTYPGPGTYPVTLIVSNFMGSDTITDAHAIHILIADAPDVDFSYSQQGNTLHLVAPMSQEVVQIIWMLPGGANVYGVDHYDLNLVQTGVYHIGLLVANRCTNELKFKDILVSEILPAAEFTFDTLSCGQVQFHDQSLHSPTAWHWSFEHGNPPASNDPNPLVQFPEDGIYQVELLAENGAGFDHQSHWVTVQYPPSPVASFESEFLPVGIQFVNTSMNAGHFLWNINGQVFTDSVNFTYTGGLDQNLEITLTAFDNCGRVDSFTNWLICVCGTQEAAGNGLVLSVAPNPSGGMCNLYIDNQSDALEFNVSLVSSNGEELKRINTWVAPGKNQIPLNLQGFPDGVYWLKTRSIFGEKSLKLMLHHGT